jgi:6-hydroxynicotinate 3-monooxygenase
MSIQGKHIAVIGAGIGGLTVASALRQFGIDTNVYEQATQFSRVGAGIHVAPNAVLGLMGAGLPLESLTSIPAFPASARHRDGYSGELTADLTLGANSWREFGAPYTLWHRGDLHAALVTLTPADRIHLGKRLIQLRQEDDVVTLSFADGSQVEADIVIASDGLHSVVRQLVFAVDEAVNTGKVAYRSVLDRTAIRVDDLDPSTKWWGTDRHFVHYEVSGGREVAFTTSVAEDQQWGVESWSATGDPEVLRAAFADFHPTVRAILDAVKVVNKWALHTREPLERWSDRRVVLVGDACHTMPPYMGQGGAMSIEDAVVLARALGEATDHEAGIANAFASYEATRRARTTLVQQTSNNNGFGRFNNEVGWVYGYDAWAVPLISVEGSQLAVAAQ